MRGLTKRLADLEGVGTKRGAAWIFVFRRRETGEESRQRFLRERTEAEAARRPFHILRWPLLDDEAIARFNAVLSGPDDPDWIDLAPTK